MEAVQGEACWRREHYGSRPQGHRCDRGRAHGLVSCHLLAKLHARSRAHAVALGFRRGLIS